MSVAVVDDWGRRDAGENGGEVPGSVYQPSVPDKRAYRRRIYTDAGFSLPLSLCDVSRSLVQCTGNIIVRRYNSNAKTPLTSVYWDSRYYFYTRDTASVPRDKGRAYMTLWNDDGSRQLLDEQ